MKQGFTLIELMIVVGIIGILSMMAIPMYGDYTKRTYIAEGLALASGLKNEMMDFHASEGRWPWNMQEIKTDYLDGNDVGFDAARDQSSKIQGQGVYDISIPPIYYYTFADGGSEQRGMIAIYYNEKLDPTFTPPQYASQVYPSNDLYLMIATNDNQEESNRNIQWRCVAKGKKIFAKWLPANCREQIYTNGAASQFESDDPDDQRWREMWD